MAQLKMITIPIRSDVKSPEDVKVHLIPDRDTDFLDPRKKARKRHQTYSSEVKENMTHVSKYSCSSTDLSQTSGTATFPSIESLQPPISHANNNPYLNQAQFCPIQPSLQGSYTIVKIHQRAWSLQMILTFKLIPHSLTSELVEYALPQLSLLEFLCIRKVSMAHLFVLLSQYSISVDLRRDLDTILAVESACRNKLFLENELGFIGAMLLLQPEAVGVSARNDVALVMREANNLKNQLVYYLLKALGNEGEKSMIHLVGIFDLFRLITKISPSNLDYILNALLR
ncbi:hypothetical protein Ciccas_013714 [Cichlidogyrus casuarinus]|uniref:Uncharacterized protein n=1 Tax=Cichlidogyrus casuarinus TaxID=1844966 RepID=A0ABD2PMY4_9PLAT